MAWHVEFQPRIAYLAWNCDVNVKSVSIAHALRWRVASVGITLQSVSYPIWDNTSGAGSAPVGEPHSEL